MSAPLFIRILQKYGVSPQGWTPEGYGELGHFKKPILSVIRAKCLDCSGGSPNEVRLCQSANCDPWPHRMGSNPFRTVTDAQREYG